VNPVTENANLFKQLSEYLKHNQHFWRPVAFHQQQLPWMVNHVKLVERLFALSLEEIDSLASSPYALANYLVKDLPFAHKLIDLSALNALESNLLPPVSPHFYSGMPGRKWQQVSAFASCFEPSSSKLLEWCAGKSYLGFYLQHLHNSKVDALEWNEDLVKQANERAQQQDCNLHSHCIDVMSKQSLKFLKDAPQVAALHACGELHEQLLQRSVEAKVAHLHLAPCCYHKRNKSDYVPLSLMGRALDLNLNKTHLHTAVMETVTAGATLQRQRKQLQIMRLGFDCLQRELLGKDDFLAIPSLPTSWSKAEFSEFCRHCASLKNMVLPNTIDWPYYLQQGMTRFHQVSALDLVRFLFRRPLEVWLVLDKVIFLEEQGYSVKLGTFCPGQVTPRNIMIKAKLAV
jgi:hypothetical protein